MPVIRTTLKTQNRLQEIASGYRKKGSSAAAGIAPIDTAGAYLMDGTYQLCRDLIGGRREEMMARAGRRLRCEQRDTESIFGHALRIINVILQDTGKSATDRARRTAHALEHAHRCNVPAEYLVGFIHQIGGIKQIEKLRAEAAPRSRARNSARATAPTKKRDASSTARARSPGKKASSAKRKRIRR